MIRKGATILCLLILMYCGCSQNKQPVVVDVKKSLAKPVKKQGIKSNDVKRAKEWLLTSIARYLKADIGNENDTSIFTKQYLEYKHDAIGRDFDGLTEEAFAHKWKGKYNTKFASRNSILIGQQDWVNPRVTHCDLEKQAPGKAFIFHVVIEDADAESRYIHKRDIKVISNENTFLIDDILEYD